MRTFLRFIIGLIILGQFAATLPPPPLAKPVHRAKVVRKLQTPRAAELTASFGTPMLTSSSASFSLVAVRTVVTRIAFAWNESQAVDSFIVSRGIQPGIYTNAVVIPPTNTYTLVKSNWPERSSRHFFVVQAQVGADVSIFSNEIHWPPYPPDHVRITRTSGSGPVTIYATGTLSPPIPWQALVTITGTNQFTEPLLQGQRFYGSPDAALSISMFNPLN